VAEKRTIVVTGMGAITPLGLSVDEHWKGLIAGKSAIGPITRFDTEKYPVKVAAEVKGFDPENYMDIKRVDRTSLCTQYCIAATGMALKAARLDINKVKPERIGTVIATSGSMDMLIDEGEVLNRRGPMRINPLLISKISPSMVSAITALEFGLKGPNSSLNSACASGNDAIGLREPGIRNNCDLHATCGMSVTISESAFNAIFRSDQWSNSIVPSCCSTRFYERNTICPICNMREH